MENKATKVSQNPGSHVPAGMKRWCMFEQNDNIETFKYEKRKNKDLFLWRKNNKDEAKESQDVWLLLESDGFRSRRVVAFFLVTRNKMRVA